MLIRNSATRGASTLFLLWAFRSGVCNTVVGSKFLVTLAFVVFFHFLNRVSQGRIRRLEHPRAFRTAPAEKILRFDPHEVTTHA
jgi:hypothetical protein